MIASDKDYSESCLIQRLIIFHLGLLPGELSGGFDESASNEEICEHILYYIEIGMCRALEDSRCRYFQDEAIRFAGLCSAFYSIQSTLNNQMNEDTLSKLELHKNRTKEVFLSTGTLVFIPLETSEVDGIVAVAQLQKSSSQLLFDKNSKADNSITPHELRHRLEKGHDLFKLMNGGGIHLRLRKSIIPAACHNNTRDTSHHHQEYEGMAELYDHLKTLRKLRYSHFLASDDDKESIEKEIHTVENHLNSVTEQLPLDNLRLDLRQFYDSFLRNIANSKC